MMGFNLLVGLVLMNKQVGVVISFILSFQFLFHDRGNAIVGELQKGYSIVFIFIISVFHYCYSEFNHW